MDEYNKIARECILANKPIPPEIVAKVKCLDLHDTEITDAELPALKLLTSLEWLSLSHTRITDAGLEYLPTGLKYLWLEGTAITDAGLAPLQFLPALEVLDIMDTDVTFAGVKRFQKALPWCIILLLMKGNENE